MRPTCELNCRLTDAADARGEVAAMCDGSGVADITWTCVDRSVAALDSTVARWGSGAEARLAGARLAGARPRACSKIAWDGTAATICTGGGGCYLRKRSRGGGAGACGGGHAGGR